MLSTGINTSNLKTKSTSYLKGYSFSKKHMKILVTGSADFIGFHLVKKLLEDSVEVVGFDNINSFYDPALKHGRLGQFGISKEMIVAGKITQKFAGGSRQFRTLV